MNFPFPRAQMDIKRRQADGRYVLWAYIPDPALKFNQKLSKYPGMPPIKTWQAIGVFEVHKEAEQTRDAIRKAAA